MNDDLETQILNSTTPHIGTDDVDESDASKPISQSAKSTGSDAKSLDPFDEKVFDVSPDFNISEAENLPAQKRSISTVYSIPPRPSPVPAPKPGQPLVKTTIPIAPKTPAPGASVPPKPPIPAPTAPKGPIAPAGKLPTDRANIPQKALRTYETDVMDVLAHTKVSATSMALAESKKKGEAPSLKTREPAAESSHIAIKLSIALASSLLVGGGAFGAYYLYTISPLAPVQQLQVQQPQAQTALVPADASVFIPIDDLSNEDARNRILAETNKNQAPKTIKEIIPTKTLADGTVVRMPGPDMLALADVGAPDILTRSLTAPWMLGVYTDDKGRKSVFIVATTDFFQNAFAGMLQWESAMPENFHKFIQPPGAVSVSDASRSPQTAFPTSTDLISQMSASLPTTTAASKSATSTSPRPPIHKKASTAGEIPGGQAPAPVPAQTPGPAPLGATATASSSDVAMTPFASAYQPIRGAFTDRIIKNKDVREFKDTNGDVLFLYSFLDNSHIILASSEAALAEAISRVENQAFVR